MRQISIAGGKGADGWRVWTALGGPRPARDTRWAPGTHVELSRGLPAKPHLWVPDRLSPCGIEASSSPPRAYKPWPRGFMAICVQDWAGGPGLLGPGLTLAPDLGFGLGPGPVHTHLHRAEAQWDQGLTLLTPSPLSCLGLWTRPPASPELGHRLMCPAPHLTAAAGPRQR